MKLYTYIYIVVILIFTSCKTDLQLDAPYKDVPVVYSVIDPTDSVHYVKVNKLISGGVNAFDYTKDDDALFYENLNVTVTNNGTGMQYTLQESWIHGMEEGIFYNDSQKVYYFIEPNLNVNESFTLKVNTGEVIASSTTDMVKNLTYQSVFTNSILFFGYSPANYDPNLNDYKFNNLTVKWNSAENASIYELVLRLNYREYQDSTNFTAKSVDWKVFTKETSNGSIQSALDQSFNGEKFYTFLSNSKLKNTSGVYKREVIDLEFVLVAGSEILNTYMTVNNPVTGILTDKPYYTNIDNGTGLFASKNTNTISGVVLNQQSMDYLISGKYTSGLKFSN